ASPSAIGPPAVTTGGVPSQRVRPIAAAPPITTTRATTASADRIMCVPLAPRGAGILSKGNAVDAAVPLFHPAPALGGPPSMPSALRRLVLVRHGATEGNSKARLIGSGDPSLSAAGRAPLIRPRS